MTKMKKYDVSIWNELSGINFKQYFVDADGVSTRIVEAGEGEPLILFMVLAVTLRHMPEILRPLSKHFRVIVLDMLGHGYTGKPNQPYTIKDYSDHLLAVIKALSLKRFIYLVNL